jgi:hypothetical protein
MSRIYKGFKTLTKKQSKFLNKQVIRIDTLRKSKWPIGIWKHAQCHKPSRKCKSKLRDSISPQLERLLWKMLKNKTKNIRNVNENVEEKGACIHCCYECKFFILHYEEQ